MDVEKQFMSDSALRPWFY